MSSNNIKSIITRKYSNFRGVDFSNNEILMSRSPLSINMWKKYDDNECIETRPGMRLIGEFPNQILGLFFLNKNNTLHVLVHSGTKLYKWTNYPNTPVEKTELFNGMNVIESKAFIFKETLFILDGINYIEYDGTNATAVVGTIPMTSYYKKPDGSTPIDADTDTDLVYQPVNVLTSYRRNSFIADGTSTNYQLDTTGLDDVTPTITINGTQLQSGFSLNRTDGIVTFTTAPAIDAEVVITFSKTNASYANRIKNCTLLCEFDNRIFFSGNPDYPNTVFHCELNDPRYVRDTAYYECGIDLAAIKAIIPGNNVLWVIKDINQNSSSVYYMTPTLDSQFDKIYPSVNGSISLGCISTGINFNDDIVFFSNNGLEGISSSSMYSEQILQHRSSLVDPKMVPDTDYKMVKLAEHNGYLMCLINSHIYLANSRQKFQNNTNDIEYEWFYWELPNEINFIKEYRQDVFFGNASGELYLMDGTTDNGEDIFSMWTTPKDDLGYPNYIKTTNKRGNMVEVEKMNNDAIHIDTIVDGLTKEKAVLSDVKGYLVCRIKERKFKNIQLKISSNKPFGLYYCTMQGFVAGYLKR